MVTVLICDDNRRTIEHYKAQLERLARKHKIQISISAFESGEALVFHLLDSPDSADIIYMDILMGKMNGMDAAKRLREVGCKAEIIFLTTSDDYVFDAFDISPVHYLVKESTSFEKFEQVFLRALSLVDDKDTEMFIYGSGGSRELIPVRDISFFEICKRVVVVHCRNNQTFEFYSSMGDLEKQLEGKKFARVHRSYIVNLQYISQFRSRSLILKTGMEIPVGVTYQLRVREVFSKYIEKYNIL